MQLSLQMDPMLQVEARS